MPGIVWVWIHDIKGFLLIGSNETNTTHSSPPTGEMTEKINFVVQDLGQSSVIGFCCLLMLSTISIWIIYWDQEFRWYLPPSPSKKLWRWSQENRYLIVLLIFKPVCNLTLERKKWTSFLLCFLTETYHQMCQSNFHWWSRKLWLLESLNTIWLAIHSSKLSYFVYLGRIQMLFLANLYPMML